VSSKRRSRNEDWSSARGTLSVLRLHDPGSGPVLERIYESAYVAPMVGAYDSIHAFTDLVGLGGDTVRVVFSATDGLHCCDLTLSER